MSNPVVRRSNSLPNLQQGLKDVAQPQPQPAIDLFEKEDMAKVDALKNTLKLSEDARLISEAIMNCARPLRARNGQIELQIAVLLMKLMAKAERSRQKDGIEQARAEELKGSLKSKKALAAMEQVESQLKALHQSRLEENNRALDGFSSMMRAQNDAIAGMLREMRGA